MTISQLTANVDAWTLQAVVASGWLARLYRSLGDERQAVLAVQVGEPGVKRLGRRGLQQRVPAQAEAFQRQHPEETQAEEAAWGQLVEAYGGISAFIAVTDSSDGRSASGLRGARTTTNAAFRRAIRGFHTAFPDEIARPAITVAIQRACQGCADAFMANVEEEDPERLAQLRVSLEACVFEAIEALGAETR